MRLLMLVVLYIFSTFALAIDGPVSETARLNSWLDARYEEELRFSPMKLTQLGRKDLYGQIDDFSEGAEISQYHWREQTVEQLVREFDYEKLSAEGKVSYDYWKYRLQVAKRGLAFINHWYAFSQMGGAHTDLPLFLINLHVVKTEQDMSNYIKRISGISRALDQKLERTKVAAKAGIRPPRFAYELVIEEAGKVIDGAPFVKNSTIYSPLWADANAKIDALVDQDLISITQADALRHETSVVLQSTFQPAYKRLIAWLSEDLPNTDLQAKGVHALPNGRNYYENLLAYFTTTNLTAEQIHQLGLAEVARIRLEMDALRQQVGFVGSLNEFFEFIRHDERFFYPNDDTGRQAYIDDTKQHLKWMNARLTQYFGILPAAPLVVKRVEPFQEQDGGAAFYKQSTADGSRPGTYYLHLSDMSALNKTQLESIAYHEGVPGHHMQVAIALERTDLPMFRNDIWYSAYGEGWALYAEYLAREMGAFSDPYSNFGRLEMEMWRAIRLVVDTGIHAEGWSEQRAVDYMLSNSSSPEVTVRSEIRRYIVWPGQATSYKVGMLKLLELRDNAKEMAGDDFDIRDFHDAILGGGSLPLPILERRVKGWIANKP